MDKKVELHTFLWFTRENCQFQPLKNETLLFPCDFAECIHILPCQEDSHTHIRLLVLSVLNSGDIPATDDAIHRYSFFFFNSRYSILDVFIGVVRYICVHRPCLNNSVITILSFHTSHQAIIIALKGRSLVI